MSRRMITTSEFGAKLHIKYKMFLPIPGSLTKAEVHKHIQDRAVRHPDCSADALFDVLSHELFRGRTVCHFMNGALAHFQCTETS